MSLETLQEIVPAGEIIRNLLNIKISTELKDFLHDFDDDALLEKTYQINKFDNNVEEILYLRHITRDIIENEAFKKEENTIYEKIDKQLKNIEQISRIVKYYFEKVRSMKTYFFHIDSCELIMDKKMDKKWIVKCRFITNPFHDGEEVKYTVIVEENGDIYKVEKEEKTYQLIGDKKIPFIIEQNMKEDFKKLMGWTEEDWNNHTKKIEKSKIEELKKDAEELEKHRLESDKELKRLDALRKRGILTDKDETVLLSALNDFYHEGTNTTEIMEIVERIKKYERESAKELGVYCCKSKIINEKLKLVREIQLLVNEHKNCKRGNVCLDIILIDIEKIKDELNRPLIPKPII